MNKNYFVILPGGDALGPLAIEEVLELYRAGKISLDTRYSTQSAHGWYRVEEILKPILEAERPPRG